MTDSEARPAVDVEEDRNNIENKNVWVIKITRRTVEKTNTKCQTNFIYLLQKGEGATAAVLAAGRWDGRLLLLLRRSRGEGWNRQDNHAADRKVNHGTCKTCVRYAHTGRYETIRESKHESRNKIRARHTTQ